MPKIIKIGQCFTELLKNKWHVLWTAVSRIILFLHSSIAIGNNKEYLTVVFKY